MLAELLREQIEAEIQQIDDLLGEFAPLLDRCHTGQPDAVERAAVKIGRAHV